MNIEQAADRIAQEFLVPHQSARKFREKVLAILREQLAAAVPAGPGRLYTTHDVAHLLQVDASTIAKWIDQEKLIAFRTPGGHRRIRESDLRAFCEKFGMPITGTLAA